MALKYVFCPQKGQQMPANVAAKDGSLRCCGCGNVHAETKNFFQADLAPVKSGKRVSLPGYLSTPRRASHVSGYDIQRWRASLVGR